MNRQQRRHQASQQRREQRDIAPGDPIARGLGEIGILNVGAGDAKLTFDPAKPEDRKRAAKVVADMLKRGYALMVQVGESGGEPVYQRAHGFDESRCEYIVMGLPEDEVLKISGARAEEETVTPPTPKMKPRKVRVPAEKTRAVSIGRSAGG